MGVHGLWKLLQPTGKPVKLESLEGKVLAVDVSIWLNQAMYGMQGYQGSTRPNAHLVVLFNRICKLLHYKIKPIFVFDGAAPELKKHTLNARRKRKELAVARAKRATDRIVKNYLKKHAVNELSKNSQTAKGRKPNLSRMLPKAEKDASIFELPPLPEDTKQRSRTILDEKEDMYLDRIDHQKAVEAQFEDISDININSQDFRHLPEEIQHEVITNIRASRKKPFWSRFKELPKKADDFSSYQLSRLLTKGRMSHRLDELQKEMKVKTSGDLAVLLDYETRLQAFEAGRVASEDNQHYLLIKQKQDEREVTMGDDQVQTGDLDQNLQPLQYDNNKHCFLMDTNMEVGDVMLIDSYDDHDKEGKSVTAKRLQPLSSKKWPPTESEDTERKKQIKREVWKFFQEYNASEQEGRDGSEGNSRERAGNRRRGRSNDGIIDEEELHESGKGNADQISQSIKSTKNRRSNDRIIDEEEVRESGKKNADQISQSIKSAKKRRSNDGIIDEEEVRESGKKNADQISQSIKSAKKRRSKDTAVLEEAKQRQDAIAKIQPQGFIGQSDINLSDEYNSDLEIDERSRVGLVTEKKMEDDCTILGEESRDCPVVVNSDEGKGTPDKITRVDDVVTQKKMDDDCTIVGEKSQESPVIDINVVLQNPLSDQANIHSETATEGMAAMNDREEKNEDKTVENNKESGGEVDSKWPPDSGPDDTTDDRQRPEHNIEIEIKPSDGPIDDDLFATNLDDLVDSDTGIEESLHSSRESPVMFDQEELDVIQEKLDLERISLEKNRGKDQRLAASVTEAMYSETKELLHLFGIPYIESPQEAEAQCAFLDLSDQCQGIITDDSDVWLFGGQRVYKNFFNREKDVMFYHDQAIERQLALDRCKLINLALLTGSDYTIGIQGVGFITALEIISEFPGDGIEGLERFRNWWVDASTADIPPADSRIRSKLCKLTLTPDFPSHVVVRTYLDPEVDKSEEKFTWNSPDLDLLRTYAQDKMGWLQSKTDEMLLPVIKRLREKVVQGKISSYFFLQPSVNRERQHIKSKRLQAVLEKLSIPSNESDLTGEDGEGSGDNEELAMQRKESKKPDMKDSSRKQSKTSVRRSAEIRGPSTTMQTVDDISDSDESVGVGTDKVAVARIAREFESDRGRHVWLGKTNQRKLFAKNNKGYGRSWQKHDWQDKVNLEGDLVPSSEAIEEATTPNNAKPDSYWEDQISDTEYDLDDLINRGSIVGKMIGGAAASKIMTNLKKIYNIDEDADDREEEGGDDDDDRDGGVTSGQAGKRKNKRIERGRRKVKQKDSTVDNGKRTKDASKPRTTKPRGRKPRTTKQRPEDGRDSDEEVRGKAKRQSRMNRQNDQSYEEEYRIEDEKEPERNEDDLRIQAQRRAKRNPYLKKHAQGRIGADIQMTLENKEKKQSQFAKTNKNQSDRLAVPEKRDILLYPPVASSGKSKRVRGKGKQLLNRKTRFKSSKYTTGPALSESSSSDE